MAARHFRTLDGFIISYDDDNYLINNYGGSDTPMDVVRLSDSKIVIKVIYGFGTDFIDVTGMTTGTFLGMQRVILP